MERLKIRGPVIGASVQEYQEYSDEVWYVIVSVDYNVGVWATDVDRSGEGRGVIVPANEIARASSPAGVGTELPRRHPVAVAAADTYAVEIAELCEAPRE